MPDSNEEKLYEETRDLPIQDYELPPPPPEDDVVLDELERDYISDKEVKTELNALKLSEPLANLLVNLINILLPALICNFTPGRVEDKPDLVMDVSEQEAATDAVAQFIKETRFDMSPAGILITTAVSIYVPKFIYVFYTKKQQHDETMSMMQRQIELLSKQNELLQNEKTKKN